MTNRKRRRDDEDDQQCAYFMMHRSYLLFIYIFYSISTVYGFDSNGNKKQELPRESKYLERDIFGPLGRYMFRRAYRINKASFYKLHSILKSCLDAIFYPMNGGTRDQDNSTYLISSKIRLGIALRYFAGGSPYDIILTHGVSYTSIFISI